MIGFLGIAEGVAKSVEGGVAKSVAAGVVTGLAAVETISKGVNSVKEIANNGKDIYYVAKDIPIFSKNIKSDSITNFDQADKKIISDDTLANESSESKEVSDKKGGSYGEVFKEGLGHIYEVHHMPADNVNGLERNDGPAIRMDKEDHRETASCGNSMEAREYRAQQKELIEQGKFREALQMDIDDIRDKFGSKYDEAISEMLEYVNKLEGENRI